MSVEAFYSVFTFYFLASFIMMIIAVERNSAASDVIVPNPMLAYGGVKISPIMKPPTVAQVIAAN
ncbi:MAG: hypothetical protein QXZ02_07230 [Candidatus Bathyarchaeia archaeon]